MPPFPQPFMSTVSHWQATNRGPSALWDHGRHDPLPTGVVDFVIVGAGVTGCSLAYQLSRPGAAADGKSIVILDAKDLASGASGRNGGHVAPASWQAFNYLTAPISLDGSGLSPDAALDVIFNEADTLRLAEEIVRKEHLDVDFQTCRKLEVLTSAEGAKRNKTAYVAFQDAKQRSSKYRDRVFPWELIEDPSEVAKISRSTSAVALNRGPGGTIHPHRLTTALARLALGSPTTDCRFFSWTPVSAIDQRPDGLRTVSTPRGSVTARSVILCTNGWTRHLLPDDMARGTGVAGHVSPFRGHAALVVPPSSYSGARALTASYGVERGPYLMNTPHSGIVLGVYNDAAIADGLCGPEDIFGVEDDSVVLPKFRDWLANYCSRTFTGWGEEAVCAGEGISRVWSGIMGASADRLPLVGPVPGHPGLWAAVAFQGHGMARILTVTRSLASHIQSGEWDYRLPSAFAITEQRLAKAREAHKSLAKL